MVNLITDNNVEDKCMKIKLPDGWILDLMQGLDWGPSSSESMNFYKAQEYCKALGGRLPTVDELQTILNRSMYTPACDNNIFKDVKYDWYWTSTEYIGCSDATWCVSFGYGSVGFESNCFGCYVRPVRVSQEGLIFK